jgi:hypothetical protein
MITITTAAFEPSLRSSHVSCDINTELDMHRFEPGERTSTSRTAGFCLRNASALSPG